MKALIREHEDGETEVITEPFSPWVLNNIGWLTGQEKDSEGNPLPGDGWTLIEDYNPDEEYIDGDGHTPVDVPEETEYVEINGIKYYKH